VGARCVATAAGPAGPVLGRSYLAATRTASRRTAADGKPSTGRTAPLDTLAPMAESLDVAAMTARFRERAAAVKKRNLPPVAGEERQRFLQQAQEDFMDFAIIGDAQASLEDGVLVLRIDLRPADQRS